ETAGVQRAFDHVAVEPAIAEECEGMGADIVRRIDVAVDAIEGDRLALGLDREHVAIPKVGARRHRHPIRFTGHDHRTGLLTRKTRGCPEIEDALRSMPEVVPRPLVAPSP